MSAMTLKEQDVLVLLKLLARGDGSFTYPELARSIGMSTSEVHAALRRAAVAGLFNLATRTPNRRALLEFLVHGVKYVFVPDRGGLTRGMPTGYAAPPLVDLLAASKDPPPVWPDPEGTVRGESFEPLYRSAPRAARQDDALRELLVLVDAIRAGRARERKLAEKLLTERLNP
jgi:hypothetical protein